MAECYPYPVTVEGDWGPNVAKQCKNKLQIYFQSKKRSNGGECLVEYEDLNSSQATVWFKTDETRQQILDKSNHELNLERETVRLTVRVHQDKAGGWNPTVPEKEASIPPEQDVPECVELTRSVKVENLPPNVSEGLLHLYFEQPNCGGGKVESITMLLEEKAAIITFLDDKVPEAVRKKAHTINKAAVKVYPYYDSLGTALYGKERPLWKLPDPFTEIMDSCVWKFLHTNNKHITILTETMAKCFCELDCTSPVAKISPSPALLKQKSMTAKHINAWQYDASKAFWNVLSKYKYIDCPVNSLVWKVAEEDIRSALTDAVILVPDMFLGKVMLVGLAEDVDRLEWVLTEIVDKATKRIEREQNSLTEKVPVVPAMYNILKHDGLVENTMKDHPELKLVYKPDVKSLILSGLAVEVFSIKSKVLEAVMHMKRKQVELNPHIVSFLSEVDNEELSYCIFTANGINAMCETQESVVFIIGNTDRALNEAEKQINTFLVFQCIEVEDSKVIKKQEWVQLKKCLDKTYNSPKKTMAIKIFQKNSKIQIVISGYCDHVKHVYKQVSDFVNRNSHIEEIVNVNSSAVIKFIKDRKNDSWARNTHIGEVRIDFQTSKPKIKLNGPRVYVLEMKKLFEKIVASLHADVLKINKPGAKKFFREQGNMYISLAMREHNCVVVLDSQEGDEKTEAMGILTAFPPSNLQKHKDLAGMGRPQPLLSGAWSLEPPGISSDHNKHRPYGSLALYRENWFRIPQPTVSNTQQFNENPVKNVELRTIRNRRPATDLASILGNGIIQDKSILTAELMGRVQKSNGKAELLFGKPGKEENPNEEFVLEGGKIDPAVLHICAETRSSVERVKSWLTDLIDKEHVEEKIEDVCIKRFTDKESKAIESLQKRLQIRVEVKYLPAGPFIQVGGLTRDVLKACTEIQDMIRRIRDEEIQKRPLFSVPRHWDDMKGSSCLQIPLKASSQEYMEVERSFKRTCHLTILKIERIQNPNLWLIYQLKKQAFDEKNGNTNNEKQLFHGTSYQTVDIINTNGFNRSFSGKNAAAYGNGTYFAVNASYSASGTYSVPDPQGQKYMYLTRVLTGVFTNGRPGMKVPPAKNASDPTDLYDSVTDNPANPAIFVIFHDVQAYPEYLVTFC
ncbi:protein mono-ADP-ribosyltransferase PARP14-like [Polyodon spathula]|uniref:protein mono-ADP-ribosyltransferase PARP14-like n=1 Tax=Polyodon spathula TaxID=7913 RepID=UPI001B7E56A6|nr:protein mono-ADP-ribosyltransferase PARP14-like [Polyodon spathula]